MKRAADDAAVDPEDAWRHFQSAQRERERLQAQGAPQIVQDAAQRRAYKLMSSYVMEHWGH